MFCYLTHFPVDVSQFGNLPQIAAIPIPITKKLIAEKLISKCIFSYSPLIDLLL